MSFLQATDTRLLPKAAGTQRQIKPKKILDEEAYTVDLERIIQRDFFPDFPKLNAQAEYFDAVEKNDLVKLREIQMKYGLKRPETGSSSVYSTPATFETPELSQKKKSPQRDKEDTNQENGKCVLEKQTKTEKKASNVSLDEYLARNTSEDNASFREILKDTQRKHREKHSWLYEREEKQQKEHEEKLALPSIEDQAIQKSESAVLHSWQYEAKNSLMYVPDGVDYTFKELLDKKLKVREIAFDNTRFQLNPFNMDKNKEILQQAASEKAHANQGKIGHDGKELTFAHTPRVNGYGFISTPSPAPGVDDSPLMTWGEIEGTPFRLDGADYIPLPKTPGPSFKIPALPKRDKIALELAEKASKAHRAKKQDALRRVTARFTSPSPKFGRSTTDRLNYMSPAARKLASSSLRIKTVTDKALRASYTPSPSHRQAGDKTPVCLIETEAVCSTPESERTVKRAITFESSLTDNLLNLPKRQKASDFF